ncbi:hypothetical protein N9O68_05420, partial [Candidatus Pelagibacter ubique]|nr:hypothetical protein [Candidatus Pelagibacter ubique]
MYKKILVTLRTYNDIDHIVPIIWDLLEKGHHLFVFGISNYDFNNDYRIKFIRKYKNIKIFIPKQENKFYQILKYNIFSILYFLTFNKIDTFLSEWKRPHFKSLWGQFFYACKALGILKIAVPHGYNVFLNDDVNIEVSKKINLNSQIFADRNEFDYYVLATDTQRDQAVRLGLSEKKTISMGSARYSRKWHDVLATIEQSTPRENINDKVYICFMTPHWTYNVNKTDILHVIEKIGLIKNVVLYVKPHTRGTGYIDSTITNKYQSNIKYVTNETSFELISKTDITIAFGTSIVLE